MESPAMLSWFECSFDIMLPTIPFQLPFLGSTNFLVMWSHSYLCRQEENKNVSDAVNKTKLNSEKKGKFYSNQPSGNASCFSLCCYCCRNLPSVFAQSSLDVFFHYRQSSCFIYLLLDLQREIRRHGDWKDRKWQKKVTVSIQNLEKSWYTHLFSLLIAAAFIWAEKHHH